DDNEGDMAISDKLDIAVGRILAENYQSASELVDKIERYYIDASFGSWRNNFVVISDDVDIAWEQSLQATTDFIGDEVAAEKRLLMWLESIRMLTSRTRRLEKTTMLP